MRSRPCRWSKHCLGPMRVFDDRPAVALDMVRRFRKERLLCLRHMREVLMLKPGTLGGSDG